MKFSDTDYSREINVILVIRFNYTFIVLTHKLKYIFLALIYIVMIKSIRYKLITHVCCVCARAYVTEENN